VGCRRTVQRAVRAAIVCIGNCRKRIKFGKLFVILEVRKDARTLAFNLPDVFMIRDAKFIEIHPNGIFLLGLCDVCHAYSVRSNGDLFSGQRHPAWTSESVSRQRP